MKTIRISLAMLGFFSVLLGFVYPLALVGLGRLAMPATSGGSLISVDNVTVGSALVGQRFTRARYFHGRPSAGDYDGLASGGSNSGPTKRAFIDEVRARVAIARSENGTTGSIPADLVLSSGSGLDPHISRAAAECQVERVARARGLDRSVIMSLVDRHTVRSIFGIAGEGIINVLELNLALDGGEGTR